MRRARAKETLTETVLMSELYSPPLAPLGQPGIGWAVRSFRRHPRLKEKNNTFFKK